MPAIPEPESLWQAIGMAGWLPERWLADIWKRIPLAALSRGTSLSQPIGDQRGLSVLLLTRSQLATALALIELDGIARRIVLCPPTLAAADLPSVMETAEIDVVISEWPTDLAELVVSASSDINTNGPVPDRMPSEKTEWVLLTSGTTGTPKLVAHTLKTLTPPSPGTALGHHAVWSTFYDIRRYGGLQMFLRAMIGGGSMVLSDAQEPVANFVERARISGVTHISGTPSHWRRALMGGAATRMSPHYVRLSGEIADQPVLDNLRAAFPKADVAHAFAATEAGIAFAVNDGLAGFPASLIGQRNDIEMQVDNGSLRIRSKWNALRYLGNDAGALVDPDGFVDTGDMVVLENDRYYFAGRRNGVINIGGQKVYPEEIEAVINRHPDVRMSLVKARRNPITGAIVVADVVLAHPSWVDIIDAKVIAEIHVMCQENLASYKVPVMIRIVPEIEVTSAGKISRV
jgi:acyl-coenzyme A synthetase/AMP-(fatty) acid ligase